MRNKIVGYASGLGLIKSWPYDTQYDAYNAMRLTPEAAEAQRKYEGTMSPYPVDIVVWPKTV